LAPSVGTSIKLTWTTLFNLKTSGDLEETMTDEDRTKGCYSLDLKIHEQLLRSNDW